MSTTGHGDSTFLDLLTAKPTSYPDEPQTELATVWDVYVYH